MPRNKTGIYKKMPALMLISVIFMRLLYLRKRHIHHELQVMYDKHSQLTLKDSNNCHHISASGLDK